MDWPIDPERGLHLRLLEPGHIRAAHELATRAFGSEEVGAQVEDTLRVYCDTGRSAVPWDHQVGVFVAASYYLLFLRQGGDETPVGLTGLYRPAWAGKGVSWLGWFAIDPPYRNRGHGSRLLQATMALAARHGARLLCIETSPALVPALKLYARLGFRERGRVPDYWGSGDDLLILHRPLGDTPTSEVPDGL